MPDITQQALAEKADLHITSVQRIESGPFDLRTTTLFRIVQAPQCIPVVSFHRTESWGG